MDELEQTYRALVERVNGYPMSEAARARILGEIEVIYQQDRARLLDARLGRERPNSAVGWLRNPHD